MEETTDREGDAMTYTCDDCFFRRADLCAIPGNSPCPTFRLAARRPPSARTADRQAATAVASRTSFASRRIPSSISSAVA